MKNKLGKLRYIFQSPYFQNIIILTLAVGATLLDVVSRAKPKFSLQNFGGSVYAAQFAERRIASDGSITSIGRADESLSAFFTAAFALELALNVAAHRPIRFAADGWNWLNTAAVALSFVALAVPAVPAWLVKLMRSVRIIHLFGQMPALKRTIWHYARTRGQ
jgi:hypothetical protein